LKDAIGAIAPQASVRVVPLGLDLSLYPFIPLTARPSAPVISLIGSMDWCPSYSAAKRLLTRLWPAIKKQVPRARLQLVGRNAKSALRGFLPLPDVDIAENVPDTRPYFESTGVLLYAPEQASGMKVKVLEAFAYGVPVVTTFEGIEGIPAEDGVHAGVCEDDDGLIQRTIALLADKERQERQRIAARQLLSEHCNPQVTLNGVERCYREMLPCQEKISA
jgi:glycosyltransferase involved in cell wall biosynthesis